MNGQLQLIGGKFMRDGVEVPPRIGDDEQIALLRRAERHFDEVERSKTEGILNGITSMVFPGEEVKVGAQADLFGAEAPVYESVGQYIIDRICRDLEEIGYEVIPIVIPACAVGAPHERMRCFFLAHRTNAGTEDVQGSEDGILSAQSVADTYGHDAGRYGHGKAGRKTGAGKSQQEEWERLRAEFERTGEEGTTPNSNSVMQQCGDGSRENGWNQPQVTTEPLDSTRDWQDFPTQSPICRRDDGFPGRISGITVSRWRNESIKALGNAIVPQVAYRIFKAINECEK